MKTVNFFGLILLIFVSCTGEKKQDTPSPSNETSSKNTIAQFTLIDSVFIVPEYVGRNFACLERPPFSQTERLASNYVTTYFSEYSSIYFFTTISPKQIIFETFNELGTPKPNLIFYLDNLPPNMYQSIVKYFKDNRTYKNLRYTHNSAQHRMLKDQAKPDFGELSGGEKYPLTRIESEWIVKRHLQFFSEISGTRLLFKEELLFPIFYNLCRNKNELDRWMPSYPELVKEISKK